MSTKPTIKKTDNGKVVEVSETAPEKQIITPEEKNIFLLVSPPTKESLVGIKKWAKENNQKFRFAFLYNPKSIISEEEKSSLANADILIPCDTTNWLKVEESLLPYKKQITAINCRREVDMSILKKVIPHLPHVKAPTSESLEWATDKLAMREKLMINHKELVPKFMVVSDYTPKTLQKIKDEINFPLIIKPGNLAASLFVNICYHKEELEDNLKKIFAKIETTYKENKRSSAPKILVEQFMEGEMYSIDAYIMEPDKIEFCPMVHVKTGKSIGFDDFFGYCQTTPSRLKIEQVEAVREVAIKTINALGLKYTSVHIELMKTNEGWKIIELGPRIGGFRHKIYKLSCGIDHYLNDLLLQLPRKPIIPKKCLGFSSAMKFFAKKEGILRELKGIKKIETLDSVKEIAIKKKIGDKCLFAKNGGRSVFDLILFNSEYSELLADIRRIEKTIVIKTSKNGVDKDGFKKNLPLKKMHATIRKMTKKKV